MCIYHQANGFVGQQLQHWDLMYWSERQKKALFGFDEEQLRSYFALPTVLDGLFALCNRLFGITIVPTDSRVSCWHKVSLLASHTFD